MTIDPSGAAQSIGEEGGIRISGSKAAVSEFRSQIAERDSLDPIIAAATIGRCSWMDGLDSVIYALLAAAAGDDKLSSHI